MSESKKTTVIKEVSYSVGYGFSDIRHMSIEGHIVDGGLKSITLGIAPLVNSSANREIKLEDDALKIFKLFVPMTQDFLEELEKEVGNVR